MKILLAGEYSRLHNSLKEGLIANGHQVTLISTGDYFKNYPSDIKLNRPFQNGLLKKIKVGLYMLFNFDIASWKLTRQFFKHKNTLIGYDIVQLINESPFGVTPRDEKRIISFLKENNKKVFLLSCGTDYTSVKYAFDKKLKYSILTPFFEKRMSEKDNQPILKYLKPEFKNLHEYVYSIINGVYASDMDYHLPLHNHPKYLGLIPNPINTDILENKTVFIHYPVVIFHGINRNNYYKKGNDFFEKSLEIIKNKYPEKVKILTIENLPYSEYIKSYDEAHILLDQIYAYDQGYNALEAMAKGKVVFTGAEQEFLDYYSLKEDEVCINALPDVDYLVAKLSRLIENPDEIKAIGQRARKFIEKEHHYVMIAQKYIDIWNNGKF